MGDGQQRPQRQIAIYGKGGIGKSTVVSNLAVLLGMDGQNVLLVGCDPKHDTSYKVCDVRPVPTVLGMLHQRRAHDLALDDFIVAGRHGVQCIEAGGPEPGVGCAGRGLSKMFELFETMHLFANPYDVILYDVLGDVVCGGFAVPMRKSYAAEVLIVVSGEVMSLYAANNICRALVRLQHNGVRLRGVVGNLRGGANERTIIDAFAERIGSRVLHCLSRDPLILEAEIERRTVVEHAPESQAAEEYRQLLQTIQGLRAEDGVVPRAMGELGFEEFVRERVFAQLASRDASEIAAPPPMQGFQPDRFTKWAMRVLSGSQVHCQDVLFEPDGHLLLRLTSDEGRATLRLGPRQESPAGETVNLPFGTIAPATAADASERHWQLFARYVARRLEAIRNRFQVPVFELLQLDEPEEVFEFGPGLFRWRIGELLVPGQTRYGPFVYAGEQFDGASLLYRFESSSTTVVLRLDMGSAAPEPAFTTRHLTVSLATDERTSEERALPEQQVERYLGFLFSLCDPPSARYDFRQCTEAIVAGSTQEWGADLAVQFFADPGYDFLSNYYAVFGLRWPAALLYHGERECSHMGTYSPGPMRAFVEHPMHIRPRRGMSDRVFVTDLRETDAVMGGEDRLREALRTVGNRDDIRTVVVHDTCTVRVMGDDVRRCIAEVQDEVSASLLYLDATAMDEASPFAQISQFWQELVASAAEHEPKRRPGSVNLVGYGFSDDPHVIELTELLAGMGVSVNAALFPGLDWDAARRFLAADRNVISPWEYVRRAFEGVAEWSSLPSHSPTLPLGRSGTRAWLESVCRASLDDVAAKPSLPDMNQSDAERWGELRERASRIGVGLVLVSTQAQRLLDADRWLSVPLLQGLTDMGFPLHLLCHDPPRVRAARERVDPERIAAELSARLGADALESSRTFTSAEELPELLEAGEFQLVYSEIRDDPRIRAAGKGQLSIVDLELGFAGALRTQDRLIRRAHKPSARQRYGRYLK